MSGDKKRVRKAFRDSVFKRDGYKCVCCGKKAPPSSPETILDAHHITNRNDLPGGGYVLENGISLCKDVCHLLAEEDLENVMKHSGFSKETLYEKVGSSFQKAFEASKKIMTTPKSKLIRIVLDPPRTHNGVNNPDPTDYLDFEVTMTEFQYNFFFDLVRDRIVMIERWEDGTEI